MDELERDEEAYLTGPFVRPRDEQLDYLELPPTRHELMQLLGPLQTAVLQLHAAEVRDHAGDAEGRVRHLGAAREALGESLGKFRALLNAGIEPRTGEEL